MQGRWFCSAISCARRCFLTVIGKYVPPLTVASLATITTSRPETRPTPVTSPAAGASPSYIPSARETRRSGDRPGSAEAPSSSPSELRRRRLPDVVHQGLRRRPGKEDLPHAERLQGRNVLVGDDSPGDDEDVLPAALLQELQDLGKEDVVGAGEDGQADDV